jgi:hypothetical protein
LLPPLQPDDHHFQSALIHSVCRCKQAVPQIGALGWFRLWAEAQWVVGGSLQNPRTAKMARSGSRVSVI